MDARVPQPDAHSEAYWAAALEGRLLIQRCEACGRRQFYPRQHCQACLAADPVWEEASGSGSLHSFTVVHRTPNADWAEEVPYVFALVDLDEGVRITANVLDGDAASLRCGEPVTVVMRTVGGTAVPCVAATRTST